jgi:hypothetical protein
MFFKKNKSENFTPGFICVLHTFGRDLKWNPHIHALITEGGAGNKMAWRNIKHFNYKLLRDSFRTALLNAMEARIGKSFKKIKSYIYKHCPNGFYIFAKPKFCNSKEVVKYIGRYLGRPPIATSRIDGYDGEFVTFHYNRHEDEKLVTEKIPAVDFIKKLIRHIPEKHFKMVRYYGIYAKEHNFAHSFVKLIHNNQRIVLGQLSSWRMRLLLYFNVDPIWCDCGHKLILLEICHKGTPLTEIHRKYKDSS